jgi:hypothetical protein
MSVTAVALKSNVFFTLDDAKDHLKIKLDNTEHDNRVRRLLNLATDLCEKYIDGPIKTRQYVEQHDGDASDTLVPDCARSPRSRSTTAARSTPRRSC